MLVKIAWNAFVIESVRTNVPLIVAIPRMIANAVRTVRSFRPQRPRSATDLTPSRPADLLHRGDDLVRVGARQLLDDVAVREEEDPVGDRGRARVVRDHHRRLSPILYRLAEELEDLAAGPRVEVPGGLVGEDDGRLRDQRARDRDALLLAAGELGGTVRAAVREADRLDQLVEPVVVDLLAGDRQRERDVLLGGQHRQQVEELEDEPDVLSPELGQV